MELLLRILLLILNAIGALFLGVQTTVVEPEQAILEATPTATIVMEAMPTATMLPDVTPTAMAEALATAKAMPEATPTLIVPPEMQATAEAMLMPTTPLPVIVNAVMLTGSMEDQGETFDLLIMGEFQDGCDFPVQVEFDPAAEPPTLSVFRNMPQDVMCPAMMQNFQVMITLPTIDGNPPRVIVVNDTEFDLRGINE